MSGMSRRSFCTTVAGLFGVAAGGRAVAEPTPVSKAEAFVDKAIAYIKEHGKDAALAEFNNPKGQFIDGELYIYAYDMEGNCLALGVNPKLVGKNLMELKSSNGVYQVKELTAQIKAKGTARLEAEFTNPLTKKVQPKILIAKKFPNFEGFVGSGVYR